MKTFFITLIAFSFFSCGRQQKDNSSANEMIDSVGTDSAKRDTNWTDTVTDF